MASFDQVCAYKLSGGDSSFGMDAGSLSDSAKSRLGKMEIGADTKAVECNGCTGMAGSIQAHAAHAGLFMVTAGPNNKGTSGSSYVLQCRCLPGRLTKYAVSHPAQKACIKRRLAVELRANNAYNTDGWDPLLGEKTGIENKDTEAWAHEQTWQEED